MRMVPPIYQTRGGSWEPRWRSARSIGLRLDRWPRSRESKRHAGLERHMKAGSGYRRIVVLGIGLAILTVVGALVGRQYVGRQSTAAATGPVTLASAKTQPPAGGAQDKTKDKKDGDAKGKEPEKAPVPVSVSPIEVGPVSSYITSTANLIPESEVKVLAEAEGRVAEL